MPALTRRAFITLLGGAAAWPVAARAQPGKKIPRTGVLWPNPPATFDFLRQGLKDFGYVEGRNIAFEFRWAEGTLDKLPEMATELVRLQVDVIVTLPRRLRWQPSRPHNPFPLSSWRWATRWRAASCRVSRGRTRT